MKENEIMENLFKEIEEKRKEREKMENLPLYIMIGTLLILLIIPLLILVGIAENYIFGIPANEKAQQYCEKKGYDNYIDYTRYAFSNNPIAIRCNKIMPTIQTTKTGQ